MTPLLCSDRSNLIIAFSSWGRKFASYTREQPQLQNKRVRRTTCQSGCPTRLWRHVIAASERAMEVAHDMIDTPRLHAPTPPAIAWPRWAHGRTVINYAEKHQRRSVAAAGPTAFGRSCRQVSRRRIRCEGVGGRGWETRAVCGSSDHRHRTGRIRRAGPAGLAASRKRHTWPR